MPDPFPYILVHVRSVEEKDGKQFFSVLVNPIDADPYVVLKRYSMFRNLHHSLPSGPASRTAQFPKWTMQRLHGPALEQRRVQLDDWLTGVVSRARQQHPSPLLPTLREFLDPKQQVSTRIGKLPSENGVLGVVSCSVTGYEDRDGVCFYSVEVVPENGTPFTMWKSFSMFENLQKRAYYTTLSPASPVAFPGKGIVKLSEGSVEARRKSLNDWMEGLLARCKESNSVQLIEVVKDFLLSNFGGDSDSDAGDDAPVGDEPPLGIVAIRILAHYEVGGHTFYTIEVIREGMETYQVHKRYDQFSNFCQSLQAAEPLVGQVDGFPGKSIGKVKGSALDSRKRDLDSWLVEVVQRARSAQGAPLRPLVRQFLDEAHKVQDIDRSFTSDCFNIESVDLPLHEERQGTVFYAIDIKHADHEPYRIWKSYSMFSELCKQCADAVLGARASCGFPGRSLRKLSDEGVKQRHEALRTWFTSMVERAKGDDYKLLRPFINSFINPSHA